MSNMGLLKKKTLERKEGNFEPVQYYDANENTNDEINKNDTENKNEHQKKKKKYDYQTVSIKIPKNAKSDLDALKIVKKLQFDYEVLNMVVDYYISNLNHQDFKKYKSFKDML